MRVQLQEEEMSSYDANPRTERLVVQTIVKDIASCSLKKLSKHTRHHQPRALGISARHDLQ